MKRLILILDCNLMYKILKTQKQYMKIIISNVVNRFGDSIDQIAFVWIVYEITHSAVWSTIIFGMNILPTICIQPFAGAFVERLKKRNIMVLCDMMRGLFALSIVFICGSFTYSMGFIGCYIFQLYS